MVEKIIINPTKVRGYGNIVSSKGANDFITYAGSITEGTDTVYGATEKVYTVEDTFIFTDGGTTNNKNTDYTTGSALTISTTTEGTSVSSTSSNSGTGRYRGNTAITGDFELIADVKLNQAYSSVGLYFGVYSNDYTIFRIKTQDWVTVKIKRVNSSYTVQTSTDGTTWTDTTFQQNNSTSNSVYPVLYIYNNSGSSNSLTYKNLLVLSL